MELWGQGVDFSPKSIIVEYVFDLTFKKFQAKIYSLLTLDLIAPPLHCSECTEVTQNYSWINPSFPNVLRCNTFFTYLLVVDNCITYKWGYVIKFHTNYIFFAIHIALLHYQTFWQLEKKKKSLLNLVEECL